MRPLIAALLLTLCTALLPSSAQAQQPTPTPAVESVTRRVCAPVATYASLEAAKEALLVEAKRQAVSALFGEWVTSSTWVENFVVTSDQSHSQAAGFVRIREVRYGNGPGLGEICATLDAYILAEDHASFQPVLLKNQYCHADGEMTVAQLQARVREEVLVQALLAYDRRLMDAEREVLLRLLRRVAYTTAGFVPNTETYCATAQGEVIPAEVLALVDELNRPTTTPTPTWTPTATRQATHTPTRRPASTATARPTQTPTPRPTSTPTRTATLQATNTPTRRATNTATARPTQTPTPRPTNTPTPGCTVRGIFQSVWQTGFGCPTGEAQTTSITVEHFERGYLVWVKATDRIYLLAQGAAWREYGNPWQPGEDSFACSEARQIGFPAMGFGKIWCQEAQALLGRPLDREIPRDVAYWQGFTGATVYLAHNNLLFVLYRNGAWELR